MTKPMLTQIDPCLEVMQKSGGQRPPHSHVITFHLALDAMDNCTSHPS